MGIYDDESYVVIAPDYIPMLFNEDITIGINRVKLIGDYRYFEIRANLVPYNASGDILLHNVIRRENGRNIYTAEIPQRIVTMLDFMSGVIISPNEFKDILHHNMYMALAEGAADRFTNTVKFGDSSIFALMNRMGLRAPDGGYTVSYGVHADEVIMYGNDHCIDIYMLVKVGYATIESSFIYVPGSMFEQYCNSRSPESYAVLYGFHPDDYDETSRDFRMNPSGKKQLLVALDLIRQKKLI